MRQPSRSLASAHSCSSNTADPIGRVWRFQPDLQRRSTSFSDLLGAATAWNGPAVRKKNTRKVPPSYPILRQAVQRRRRLTHRKNARSHGYRLGDLHLLLRGDIGRACRLVGIAAASRTEVGADISDLSLHPDFPVLERAAMPFPPTDPERRRKHFPVEGAAIMPGPRSPSSWRRSRPQVPLSGAPHRCHRPDTESHDPTRCPPYRGCEEESPPPCHVARRHRSA